MGNTILRHKKQEIVETPEMKKLSLEQIDLIKKTWIIPNQKVSELQEILKLQ